MYRRSACCIIRSMEAKKGSRYLRYILSVAAVLTCLAACLLAAAKHAGGFAQWYSVNVYSLITATAGRLSGAFPFSLSETLVIILPALIIADLIRCLRGSAEDAAGGGAAVAAGDDATGGAAEDAAGGAARDGSVLRRLLTCFLHLVLTASVLFFLYAANCGVNYYRDPFVDPAAAEKAVFTGEQLEEFCIYTAKQLEASYTGEGGMEYPKGSELASSARSSMLKLSEEYPSLQGYYPRPKQISVIAGAFSAMGVSGIYSPFTVEANVNGQIPDIEKPFTSCHELSHLRGYMIEGEANYIGWLACIGSDDPAFRRSGWLMAWLHAGGNLRRTDPEAYERLRAGLPADALDELDEIDIFWKTHETSASEVQDRVNDAYLRSNGLDDGIQSYGMLTKLMLMWYFGT